MRIGFACAYAPLPLIDAAGGRPFRILPESTAADQAGRILHDNMCPHVKRILDRAMGDDLPELGGVVLTNSCDTMRRLADGWRRARPEERVFLIDLPPAAGERSTRWFAAELERLRRELGEWTGHPISDAALKDSIARYNQLATGLSELRERLNEGGLTGGSPALQRVYNRISTSSLTESLALVRELLAQPTTASGTVGVPVHLFGNVLSDPAVFELIEECGARVVSDDLCTGGRLVQPIPGEKDPVSPIERLADGILSRSACARTMTPDTPGQLGEDLVARAREVGARGVIAHIVKFCDPYLGRLPAVRQALKAASLPLLVLEGDCTLRSVGQQATRIEAFVEMLEETL